MTHAQIQFPEPQTALEATAFYDALRANPTWELGDDEFSIGVMV